MTGCRSGSHRVDSASGGTVLVKRIGSMAWRVQVSDDGAIIALGVRTDRGREYEVLLGTVDSTPIVTDLLNEMVRTHRGKPPRIFSGDAGPNHARSVPVQPTGSVCAPHVRPDRYGQSFQQRNQTHRDPGSHPSRADSVMCIRTFAPAPSCCGASAVSQDGL